MDEIEMTKFVKQRGFVWDELTDTQKEYYKDIKNMNDLNLNEILEKKENRKEEESSQYNPIPTKDNFYIGPIFKDQTVYIVGGGPSLKDFDFSLLQDKYVIAVNKAYQFVPDAQVLYWSDRQFYNWEHKGIHEFKGLKVTNKDKPSMPDIINMKDTGSQGLETDPSGLRSGHNSGYAAMNLAYHTGVNRIILLGFDMRAKDNKTHFHKGYPSNPQHPDVYERRMMPMFGSLVEPLKDAGIQVINGCKDSELKHWFRCTPEDALYLDEKNTI